MDVFSEDDMSIACTHTKKGEHTNTHTPGPCIFVYLYIYIYPATLLIPKEELIERF